MLTFAKVFTEKETFAKNRKAKYKKCELETF